MFTGRMGGSARDRERCGGGIYGCQTALPLSPLQQPTAGLRFRLSGPWSGLGFGQGLGQGFLPAFCSHFLPVPETTHRYRIPDPSDLVGAGCEDFTRMCEIPQRGLVPPV